MHGEIIINSNKHEDATRSTEFRKMINRKKVEKALLYRFALKTIDFDLAVLCIRVIREREPFG
jgi:hypothetical protein